MLAIHNIKSVSFDPKSSLPLYWNLILLLLLLCFEFNTPTFLNDQVTKIFFLPLVMTAQF